MRANLAEWCRLTAALEVWLLVDDRSFRAKNPAWATLVPPASTEGLQLAFETSDVPAARMYRVTPERLVAAASRGW